MATGSAGDERSKLEQFDGSDPGAYRMWKRRAKLMLAGLPTTVGKERYGARLMEFVKGEAEALLETIDVEDLIKAEGDKLIFNALDEKYLPQPRDLIQQALKGYFYELSVRPGETFQQFIARHESAVRKLKEQDIELPSKVRGFMFIKKLRLDSQQEAMVLTATKGEMLFKEIVQSVRAIFPEGRGSARNTKDVFTAEIDSPTVPEAISMDNDGENEVMEVMEALAWDHQLQSDVEEEEVLEAFESYADVRKKIQERKKARGFQPVTSGRAEGQWRLAGTVKGKLDLIKARTRCFRCQKVGHWKRDCPERTKKPGRSAADPQASQSTHEAHSAEVLKTEVVEVDDESEDHQKMWKLFEEKTIRKKAWKSSVDVQQSGFADTHATGNRQRPGPSEVMVAEEKISSEPHAEKLKQFSKGDDGPSPEKSYQGEEVLSVDQQGESFDPILGTCAVPDTACRRTLIGSYTLQQLEKFLRNQGYKTIHQQGESEFRFGNAGTLVSKEVVILPANIGGKNLLIRAAVLPGSGQYTSLLLSKELLKQLGAIVNMSGDTIVFSKLGKSIRLGETSRGHYAIPMFDFSTECHGCFETMCNDDDDDKDVKVPCKRKTKTDSTYDISKLESRETQHDEAASRDSADPSHAEHDLHGWSQQQGGEHTTNAAECDVSRCGVSSGQSVHGKHRREEGPSSRPSGESHRWELCDEGWQVRQGEGRGPCHVSGTNLQHGQALRAVGQVPYFREVKCGHAAAPSLHSSQGHSEEQATSVDAERGSTTKATSAESEQEHGTTSQCSQVHEGQEPPLRSRRDGGGSLVNGEHEQRRRKCGSEGDIDRSSGGMGAFREIHASATECSEGRDAPSHPAHGCQPPCKVHHGNDLYV